MAERKDKDTKCLSYWHREEDSKDYINSNDQTKSMKQA